MKDFTECVDYWAEQLSKFTEGQMLGEHRGHRPTPDDLRTAAQLIQALSTVELATQMTLIHDRMAEIARASQAAGSAEVISDAMVMADTKLRERHVMERPDGDKEQDS